MTTATRLEPTLYSWGDELFHDGPDPLFRSYKNL